MCHRHGSQGQKSTLFEGTANHMANKIEGIYGTEETLQWINMCEKAIVSKMENFSQGADKKESISLTMIKCKGTAMERVFQDEAILGLFVFESEKSK